MLKSASLILVLLVLFGSCSSSTQVPPLTQAIWPLAIGNQWIGEVTSIDEHGTVLRTYFDTIRIDSSFDFNGETWYFSKQMWNYRPDPVRAFVERADGVWTSDSDLTNPTLFLKYPGSVNDTFAFKREQFGPRSSKWYGRFVAGGAEATTVPAGQFLCMLYQISSGFWNYDYGGDAVTPTESYAPGVGPVQCGYFAGDGHTPGATAQDVWRLVSYSVR